MCIHWTRTNECTFYNVDHFSHKASLNISKNGKVAAISIIYLYSSRFVLSHHHLWSSGEHQKF